MKTLLILRGINPEARENWINDNNLGIFTINMSDIRKLYSTPEAIGDKIKLTRDDKQKTSLKFYEALETKLKRGCLVVVDGENILLKDINKLSEFASIFGYKSFVKSFGIEADILEIAGKYRKISIYNESKPEEILDNVVKYLKTTSEIKLFSIDKLEDIEDYWKNTGKFDITIPINQTIINVGDIHGYYETIANSDIINQGIKDGALIVFHGDYIDRGPKSKDTLDYVFKLKLKYPSQIILLEGNHEVHLRKYLSGYKHPINKTEDFFTIACEASKTSTIPEFEKLSDKSKKLYLEKFNKHLQTNVTIRRGNQIFYCTHSGFTSLSQLNYKMIGNVIYGNRNIFEYDRKISYTLGNNSFSIHGHCRYNIFEPRKFNNVINLDPEIDGEIICSVIDNNNIKINKV